MRGATTGLTLRPLTLEAFEADTLDYDRAAAVTPNIDTFCSSSAWILPAHYALMPPRQPWLLKCEEGYVPLMRGEGPDGDRYLQPLEAAWGLASCFIGPQPARLVPGFVANCMVHRHAWEGIFLTGLVPREHLFNELVGGFLSTGSCDVLMGTTTKRFAASLEGGVDGFLSRRSKNFRRSLRKAEARARRGGIRIHGYHPRGGEDAAALYRRIVDIESESWKGQTGVGINVGGMHDFYSMMLPRLISNGSLRLMFARHEDIDVGYVLGAVANGTYRGLQFSFDNRYRRFALGNLLQLSQIVALCGEGVRVYDLGSDASYKDRWAEGGLDTATVIIRQR